LAGYTGGIDGIPATKPAAGEKLNTKSWNYEAYRKYLQNQRAAALKYSGVDESKKVLDYGVTFNGFAATLTSSDVERLSHTAGVVRIFKNRILTGQTNNTPRFLGLSGSGGVWTNQFGGQSHAGEGVIIGVIDSGFWPENPSFAALPEPRPDADTIAAKWAGVCDTGESSPVTCNNKVIGARWYDSIGGRSRPGEFASPRDRNGHGSHTSSTAAGDVADAAVAGSPIGPGQRHGSRRPAGDLQSALHVESSGSASGSSVDIVKAIDDAVADGVDVINFSIGDDDDQLSAEDGSVPGGVGRGCVRRRVRRQRRAGRIDRRQLPAVGDDRRCQHPRRQVRQDRDARQRRDVRGRRSRAGGTHVATD
jgi:hypothetical protein